MEPLAVGDEEGQGGDAVEVFVGVVLQLVGLHGLSIPFRRGTLHKPTMVNSPAPRGDELVYPASLTHHQGIAGRQDFLPHTFDNHPSAGRARPTARASLNG